MSEGVEQLGLDFEVEQSAWGRWVDPRRRAARAREFMNAAGLAEIPDQPWPPDWPETPRLDAYLAGLFPDLATAMAPQNCRFADAFICFMGECFIRYAGARWVEYPWFGRGRSFYDEVNPALEIDDADEDVFTAWGHMRDMIGHHTGGWGGMFAYFAESLIEYRGDHLDKRLHDPAR
ncbi:hypothetical protein [Nocardia takedensis]|uniref:hypothetical protein n=1 Tax=Nocardia takedensis TaxID=259390 RepID=UPI00030D3B0D|nr:hypothetical protein [Nocardia takedensis]